MRPLIKLSLLLAFTALACSRESPERPLVIGSKNFSESVLLGEIVAQKLEGAGCKVDRRLNLGGTMVCHTALASGSLDAYVEYSGTALTAILNKPLPAAGKEIDGTVADEYTRLGLQWGPNLGFNNTFAIIVRKGDAAKLGLAKISDLSKVADRYRPGFGYEFTERPDGYKGLVERYGLNFSRQPVTMDLGLTYKALASGTVDFIAGNSTDGLIDSLGLVALTDDRSYFPPYQAAIARGRNLNRICPGAEAALEQLGGKIDEISMRRMNFEVDGKKRPVAEVAREFLQGAGR